MAYEWNETKGLVRLQTPYCVELRIDSIASVLIESYLWTACSPGLAGLVEPVG